MNSRIKHNLLSLILLTTALPALLIGCSRASSPTVPAVSHSQTNTGTVDNRYLWGFWEVSISADHLSAEVIPIRTGMMHLNPLNFLEKSPCTDCLKISNLVPYPDKRLSADLTLIHPFPGNPKLTGFDVRAIFITDAEYQFPVSGRWIPWTGDYPRLLLPNGYTSLFNPWEYDPTSGGPAMLNYIQGKYATGANLQSTLNGYVSFRREAPRNMFENGGAETRTVWIGLPDGPLKFGYAVDACWKMVEGQVTDPLTDFPPEANCLEAYRVDVQLGSLLEPIAGSTQPIEVRVFDHQGLDTISLVTVEAPELFTGDVVLEYDEDVGIETHLFIGTIANEFGVPAGEYPMLIRVIDTVQDPNLGQIDAWFLYIVEVGARNGWVHTWGSEASGMYAGEYSNSVATDADGFIYATGIFKHTADLDPTEGIEERTATKGAAFLTKFDTDGNFIWTRVWDGLGADSGEEVRIAHSGNILLLGDMGNNLLDLDPSVYTDAHEGNTFLVCLDPDGNYIFGDSWSYGASRISVDTSDNIYISGGFSAGTDFDPGPGEDIRNPIGPNDAFVSKLNADGSYCWTCTWGSLNVGMGVGNDYASITAVDSTGILYACGRVAKEADFDPGPGTFILGPGEFITKFDSSGQWLGACLWDAYLDSIAVDAYDNFYVLGDLGTGDIIDLDPGTGVEECSGPCSYLVSYLPGGGVRWVQAWGFSTVNPVDLSIASTDEIYITGTFHWNLVDFDPSASTDYHGSIGSSDVFLSKYLTNGEYQWTRTWGSEWEDSCRGICSDDAGNAFVVGEFDKLTDFDPGPGVEFRESNGNSDCYLTKIPPDGNW